MAIDNLTLVAAARLLCSCCWSWALFLFEWRIGTDQHHHHPAVAGRRRPGAVPAWRHVNTMVLAGFVIALGAVVDDAIVDVENIVRRLRLHRREGSAQIDAARSCSRRRLEVRGADRLRDAHRGARPAADLLPARPDRRVLPAAGHVVRPGRASSRSVVALTRTPALSLILFSRGRLDPARVAARASGCSAAT